MNIAIFEACNQASDAKTGKIEIRPTILFVLESIVESERTDKTRMDLFQQPVDTGL